MGISWWDPWLTEPNRVSDCLYMTRCGSTTTLLHDVMMKTSFSLRDTSIRPGWLTVGPQLTNSNFDRETYSNQFKSTDENPTGNLTGETICTYYERIIATISHVWHRPFVRCELFSNWQWSLHSSKVHIKLQIQNQQKFKNNIPFKPTKTRHLYSAKRVQS